MYVLVFLIRKIRVYSMDVVWEWAVRIVEWLKLLKLSGFLSSASNQLLTIGDQDNQLVISNNAVRVLGAIATNLSDFEVCKSTIHITKFHLSSNQMIDQDQNLKAKTNLCSAVRYHVFLIILSSSNFHVNLIWTNVLFNHARLWRWWYKYFDTRSVTHPPTSTPKW